MEEREVPLFRWPRSAFLGSQYNRATAHPMQQDTVVRNLKGASSAFSCVIGYLPLTPILSFPNLARTPRVSLETCVPGNMITDTPERQGFCYSSSLSIKEQASPDRDMAFVSYQHAAWTLPEKRRWGLLVDLVTELLVILAGFMLTTFLSCIS